MTSRVSSHTKESAATIDHQSQMDTSLTQRSDQVIDVALIASTPCGRWWFYLYARVVYHTCRFTDIFHPLQWTKNPFKRASHEVPVAKTMSLPLTPLCVHTPSISTCTRLSRCSSYCFRHHRRALGTASATSPFRPAPTLRTRVYGNPASLPCVPVPTSGYLES